MERRKRFALTQRSVDASVARSRPARRIFRLLILQCSVSLASRRLDRQPPSRGKQQSSTKMTFDQAILSITGIGTLAAAVATFMTVRQIALQRAATYQPNLVANGYYAHAIATENSLYRFDWYRTQATDDDEPGTSVYWLSVLNLGTGPAKTVEARWSCDLAAWLLTVNHLSKRVGDAVEISCGADGATMQTKYPDGVVSTGMVSNQLTQRWEYILPTSLSRNEEPLAIPSCFLRLTAMQISLGLLIEPESGGQSYWNFPKVGLTLVYRDVAGERHEQSFDLLLKVLSIGVSGKTIQLDVSLKECI